MTKTMMIKRMIPSKLLVTRFVCLLLIFALCFTWFPNVHVAYADESISNFVLTMIFSCGITLGSASAAFTAAEEFCNFLQGKDATLYSSLMGGTEVAKENGKWVVSNAFAGKLATIIYYIYEFFSGNSIICTTDISSKGSTANIGEYSIKSIGNYLNFDDTSYMLDIAYFLKYHRGVWHFPISTFENTPEFLEFEPIVVNMKSGDSYTFSCLPGYNANYQRSYILKITYSDGSSFGSHSGKEGLTVTSSYCCEPVIVAKGGVLYFTFAIISGCIYYDESSTVNDAWRLCILDYDYGDASRYYIPLDDIADVQIESETIDVYHERGALDEETVANAWKAYGDACIAREEAVTISDAVVSDALSNDNISTLSQAVVLADSGVAECLSSDTLVVNSLSNILNALYANDKGTELSVADIMLASAYAQDGEDVVLVSSLIRQIRDGVDLHGEAIASAVDDFSLSVDNNFASYLTAAVQLPGEDAQQVSIGQAVSYLTALLQQAFTYDNGDGTYGNVLGTILEYLRGENEVIDTEYEPLKDELSVSGSVTASDVSGIKDVGGTMFDSGGSVSSFTDSSLWSSDGDTGGLFAILTEPDSNLYSSGSASGAVTYSARAPDNDVIYTDDMDAALSDTTGKVFYSPYVNGVK